MSAVHSQSPSGAMTVISANVKGLSANKASILSELCKLQHCHCLCLQETHRATANSDREAVEQWVYSNRVSLIHNAKLPKSFNSAIWKKGYNPDPILVSSNSLDMCEKSVLDPIPRTQHRPICATVHPVIVPQPTPFRRRFNLRKAKWDDFSTDFDETIEEIEPIPENYDRFIGLGRVVSIRHIPRRCRTNYIPGLTEESQSLYEAYKKQTPACTWWNRPEEDPSSGKLESTHPSRTSVKYDQVFLCRVNHACQRCLIRHPRCYYLDTRNFE